MFKSLRTYHAESIAYRSCNKFYQTVVHYKQHEYNIVKKLNDPRYAKMGLGLNLVRSACTNNCAERTRICLERFTFVNLGPIFYNAFVCYESLTKLSVCSNRWLYTDWYTGRNVLYTSSGKRETPLRAQRHNSDQPGSLKLYAELSLRLRSIYNLGLPGWSRLYRM